MASAQAIASGPLAQPSRLARWGPASLKACATRGRRFADDGAQDEHEVRRPFAQSTHEIRKPFTAEWHVHAHLVTGGDERSLQIPADTVQHLEFEAVGRHLVIACPFA